MPAAAITAVATVASGAIGARSQSRAAERASDAQVTASREATELQREQYYDTRNLSRPVAEAGNEARARQMLMQGYTPEQVRSFLESSQSAWAGGAGGAPGMSSDAELQARYPDQYAAWQQSGGGQGGAQGNFISNVLNGALGGQRQSFSQYLTANGLSTAPVQQPGTNNDWVDSWSYESSSPSYQFRFDEGQRGLERSAAARGRLFSGATGMALQRYGQGFASQEFENDFRRLGALSGAGDNAQGITINAGQNYANQAGANAMAAGNARASGYLGAGEAQANFWGNTIPGALGAFAGYGGWK